MPAPRPKTGLILGVTAFLAGALILVIDWLFVLDTPGEAIRESIVSDVGGVALLLTGAAILGVLRFQRADADQFQRDGVLTDAVIENISLGFLGTLVTVRFEDLAGTTHQIRLRGSNLAMRPALAPGTTVMIRYDPANPARLRFQETLDSLVPPL